MEQLYKRSDGFAETPSGNIAVFMLRGSIEEEGVSYFRYHPDFTSAPVEIRWEEDIAVLPADVAKALVSRNYARNLSQEEVENYNTLLDLENEDAKLSKKVKESAIQSNSSPEEKENKK